MWLGSKQGPLLLRPREWSWKYFLGPRWLPTQRNDAPGAHVTAMAVLWRWTFVGTIAGVSWIERLHWTLADQAAVYQRVSPPYFQRYGTFDQKGVTQGDAFRINNPGGQWIYPYWLARYLRLLS